MNARTVSVGEGRRLARSIGVGPHTLTADEPRPISTDIGPTPGELLLAALGSCTSMTVRAFADQSRLAARPSRCDRAVRSARADRQERHVDR
ncbi:OsmC family protein [Streptomyces sp. NBC_00444]|uniref:OsmC family protein n=1 Tax=Streptomyces sp. NBC_00444 TaxID=2975744 RepID=UPI002E238D3C